MSIHVLDPLTDRRWDELVACHPRASAFHQSGWLRALSRTYDYKPFVLTSTPPGETLRDGIVLCKVRTWITGSRLVSLPFTDHCEPLLDEGELLPEFIEWLRSDCDRHAYRYVELRPLETAADHCPGLYPSDVFYSHQLDLKPSLSSMFQHLHKDSIQRKIHRAEREGLSCVIGRSEHLLDHFYHLLLITRRRHCLPPQPRLWFKNLVECIGDKLQVWVAMKDARPMAGILTLRHRSGIVYKYGCSDAKFHSFGGMPFLFWRLIQESKGAGMEKIDFGRSDIDNEGLSTFKERFGAQRKPLTYYRYSRNRSAGKSSERSTQLFRKLFSLMPDAALRSAGSILYRHMG